MGNALRTAVTPLLAGLVVVLVACGQPESETGRATTGSSSESTETSPSEPAPHGPLDFTQIALISVSNAEGSVSGEATVLDGQQAVDEFASQFSGSQMATALNRAYQKADLSEGEVMVGAVVDVSCQAPTDVDVAHTKDGVSITADPVKSKVQCIVPVTTVALVSVPEAAV
jgi:hypothetical protein